MNHWLDKKERCCYCGRVLDQHKNWFPHYYSSQEYVEWIKDQKPEECVRCSGGSEYSDVKHAKAVRLAYKHRWWRRLREKEVNDLRELHKRLPTVEAAIHHLEGIAEVKAFEIHLTIGDKANMTREDWQAIDFLKERGYTYVERELTDTELKKCLKVLDILGYDYSGDTIWLSSGANSIICNPDFEPKEFIGASACGIVERVAEKMGKQVKWIDEGRY